MDLLIIAVLLLPLLLILWRSRQQQKQVMTLQASLVTGQEVMTTSGLYGTIAELDDEVAVLEVSPGVRVRWARPAIARVVSPLPETGTTGSTGSTGVDGS